VCVCVYIYTGSTMGVKMTDIYVEALDSYRTVNNYMQTMTSNS